MTGTGTVTDPYIIMTVDDLQDMEDDLDAFYELGGDIDASATSTWNAGAGFVPIGTTDPTAGFTGQLDGKGYTIKDLYINRSTTDYQALFYKTYNATIIDVLMTDANITGREDVGSFIGAMYSGTIRDCQSTGHTISGSVSLTSVMVGGLIGVVYDDGTNETIISDCYAQGDVSAADYVGGLIGFINASQNVTITDCYAAGAVTGTEGYAGGLIGIILFDTATLSITGCYSTASVTGGPWTGGLIGGIGLDGGTFELDECYATGDVTGQAALGGLIGDIDTTSGSPVVTITNCYATGDVTSSGTYGWISGVGGFIGYTDVGAITDCYATGVVDASASDDAQGTGGFAGAIDTGVEITQCYAAGDVVCGNPASGQPYVGGFIGWLGTPTAGGTVSECFATGNVSGYDYVGGFVGYNDGTITDCYARGNVTASYNVDPAVAGFAGTSGTIDNCYSTGEVTAPNASDLTYIGGFGGGNYGSAVTDCFWDKETSGITAYGDPAVATSKTTAEMKTKKTFLDAQWDFSTIWGRFSHCNNAYPCLRRVTSGCSVRYKGNCNVDQLCFQHAERMQR